MHATEHYAAFVERGGTLIVEGVTGLAYLRDVLEIRGAEGLEITLLAGEGVRDVRLESGDLPLEPALKEFERGVKLTRQCQAALTQAEQKVEILLKKTATAEPTPFADSDEE